MKPLLQPFRRWLAPLLIVVLSIPSVGMLFTHVERRSTLERRMLAPPPSLPLTAAGWMVLPRTIDAYLKDHFAFRSFLTSLGNHLHWQFGGPLNEGAVVRGREGRLFYRDNLLDVTGGAVRPAVVASYGRFVCAMNDRLRARAIPMVFSMAPSQAAIYPEDLPSWTPRGRPNAYDLILDRTRACGVNAVDLRPALLAAKPQGSIYYHRDTHWSEKGALIAYDQLVRAAGKPDWIITPEQLTWREEPEHRSDLAGMAGEAGLVGPPIMSPDLSARRRGLSPRPLKVEDDPTQPGFLDETSASGPTVLFIGDSFSADFMPPYFASHVHRFAWIHQQWCRFDWNVFDVVKPDLVILMPVDRAASCKKGARPLHWPQV